MNKKKRFFLKYIIKKSVEGIRGATVSSLDSHFVILTLCIFLTWRIAYFRPGGSVAGKNAGIFSLFKSNELKYRQITEKINISQMLLFARKRKRFLYFLTRQSGKQVAWLLAIGCPVGGNRSSAHELTCM